MFETWGQLGEPDDYVFAGAVVVYNASVSTPQRSWFVGYLTDWSGGEQRLDEEIRKAGYVIQAKQNNESAGNLFYRLQIPADQGSINDVKANMDGAVTTAGFGIKASEAFFISNPRRDSQQTVTSGPGKVFSSTAGNIDTFHDKDTVLGTAGDFFGSVLPSLPTIPGLDPAATKQLFLAGGLLIAGVIILPMLMGGHRR